MTTSEVKLVPTGSYLNYHGIKVMLLAVKPSGVKITYWGAGLREGQSVTEIVAARYLDKM